MTSAIRKHLADFLAVLAVFLLGSGIAAYILSNQRLRFPFVEDKPFVLEMELANAQAVQPGQGQTIRSAGVEIGQIGEVELEEGIAVVEMQLEKRYEGYVREDATALLRSKTGLKDMFVELDPGDGRPLDENERIGVANTAPDIDPDEILSALDSDTRDYLKLLVSGAGKGLEGRGTDLRETFRRFGPLHRDLNRVTEAIADRRVNLRRLIHNYSLLVDELGGRQNDLTRLVRSSEAVFDSFVAEDENVSSFVAKLPGALRETRVALEKVDPYARRLGPALESLRPPFRKLDEANRAVLPFVNEAAPIVRDEIRPFARIGQPYFRDLGRAGRDLAKAGPDLTQTFRGLNRLFNIGAHNPNGAEGLTGDLARDRARDEGYLYWLAWTAQNTVSLFSTSDAQGPFRRIFLGGVNCNTLTGEGVPEAISDALGDAGGVRELIKQTPGIGRIVAMAVFALSCVALLMFLWLAFGGSIPLRPEGYRVQVAFPEAATLAQEADVRISGVNVGKVKTKELDEGARRTVAELELDEKFSPIPRDSRAILRQKTLLGETYVELSTGNRSSGMLDDGERLPDVQVEETVELDEIFGAFDEPTRRAFQQWVDGLAQASEGSAPEDLNDAFGNLDPFATDGAELLRVLDEQKVAVHELIRNTGRVFGAINEREGALRQLIVNSNDTFEATASRDEALAETIEIFPTFLDESKATLARLERFSRDTRPLVNDLKAPADDLGPTVRDLGDLAPDLENLVRDLPPLIRASRRSVPELKRVLQEAEPLLEELHPFFQELNPILSYFNFHQATLAGFISNAAPDLSGDFGGDRYQVNVGITESTSFTRHRVRPPSERGNAYLQPNALQRAIGLGTLESFDCAPAGGEQPNAEDAETASPLQKDGLKRPPCFVAPPSLYDGKQFGRLESGVAPNRQAPGFRDGNRPAADPNPSDPLN